MKNLSLTLCLGIAALFGGVGFGFASDLPPCPASGYFHNCFGTWTWDDGNKYVGEIRDGKQHGRGTFTKSNGLKYVGEWRNGKRQGQGFHTFIDDKFVGEWKDDEPNGQGVFYNPDSSIREEGVWKGFKLQ